MKTERDYINASKSAVYSDEANLLLCKKYFASGEWATKWSARPRADFQDVEVVGGWEPICLSCEKDLRQSEMSKGPFCSSCTPPTPPEQETRCFCCDEIVEEGQWELGWVGLPYQVPICKKCDGIRRAHEVS